MTNDLYDRIYALVRAIPAGKVTSYGQLGVMCRITDPRIVGEAMNAAPADVPWQRVINSRGEISIRGATGERQRALLEKEGVEFDSSGRVDFAQVGWIPESAWLVANGYQVPPPLAKEKKDKGGEKAGEQLSLF